MRHRLLPTLILFLAVFAAPGRGAAQVGRATLGAAGGAAGGAWVTLGVVTASARAGRFVFSAEEMSWELAPVALGAVAGGVVGWRSGPRLRQAFSWSALGFAMGGALGAGAGFAASASSEDVWAGAVIGSAAGLLMGSLAGALRAPTDPEVVGPALSIAFSLPWVP